MHFELHSFFYSPISYFECRTNGNNLMSCKMLAIECNTYILISTCMCSKHTTQLNQQWGTSASIAVLCFSSYSIHTVHHSDLESLLRNSNVEQTINLDSIRRNMQGAQKGYNVYVLRRSIREKGPLHGSIGTLWHRKYQFSNFLLKSMFLDIKFERELYEITIGPLRAHRLSI